LAVSRAFTSIIKAWAVPQCPTSESRRSWAWVLKSNPRDFTSLIQVLLSGAGMIIFEISSGFRSYFARIPVTAPLILAVNPCSRTNRFSHVFTNLSSGFLQTSIISLQMENSPSHSAIRPSLPTRMAAAPSPKVCSSSDLG